MANLREVQNLAKLARSVRSTVRRPAADVRAATVVALQSGGIIVPHPFIPDAPQHVVHDASGDCLAPRLREQDGRGHFEAWLGGKLAWQPARTLSRKVRCRRCANCLRARLRHWLPRVIEETVRALRTWFVTMTFAPEVRYRLETETRLRIGAGWDNLHPAEQHGELLRTVAPLVTRYLKRLRRTGAAFRHFLVVEQHQDGFPHFHVLLHETDPLRPLRKVTIEAEWGDYFRDAVTGIFKKDDAGKRLFVPHGIIRPRLVKDPRGSAAYVAKYLGKNADARIRASRDYGERDEAAEQTLRF